jgi:prepilin-type N-terminal cleavage/methylation domain-containing protein
MLQRSIEKKRSGEGGFTLIELLVVIVILGILAAIVVFAIGGLSSSSQKTACNADANTIRTAEDAYYASPDPADPTGGTPLQKYTDGAGLVGATLLKGTGSKLYTIAVTGGGTGFTMTPIGTKCTGTLTGP